MTRRMSAHALDFELQDAYWELPSGEYVPQGSPPVRLLEDSDQLDASWTATVDSLRKEATEGDDVRRRIAKEVEAFRKRRGRASAATDAPSPSRSRTATLSKATSQIRLPLLKSLRKLTPRRG